MIDDIYAVKALEQLPRLLTLQDRNALSRTYGCFHRDYWLYKTSDFPDAVRQFGVHALALVYAHEFPGNPYYGHPKIAEWTVAALRFWTDIQHRDGSFDEFYPYERGWVGPTAFTTYAATEAYSLLRDEIEPELQGRIEAAIGRSARFIGKGEAERDHLANHFAMAALAVWKAHRLLGEPKLRRAFDRLWEGFRRLHDKDEGWSLEYDGADPGYQSATVSFLGKIWADEPDAEIFEVLRQSVEFCAYFVYPDGHYAGMMGSRNTSHFYPHGFELLAPKLPLAGTIAARMRTALSEGKLVPPRIMSDRYVFYRVPELLLASLDGTEGTESDKRLPYERGDFIDHLPKAGIVVAGRERSYMVANLAKGGVCKIFDRETGELIVNDGGVLAQLDDGRLVTSQWLDPTNKRTLEGHDWSVEGPLHAVPSNTPFTLTTGLVFRLVLLVMGWLPWLSHKLKGLIRRTLMIGARPQSIAFRRQVVNDASGLTIVDEITNPRRETMRALQVGDEFHVRYVPQSRFFQPHELVSSGWSSTPPGGSDFHGFRLVRRVDFPASGAPSVSVTVEDPKESNLGRPEPEGAYGLDYHRGRHTNRQLVYRLHRRSKEVERALQGLSSTPKTVIDVGTADGLMLEELRGSFGPALWAGIDLSHELLKVRKDRSTSAQADALALPFADRCADAVIATAVIEHVKDPQQLIREAHRVLRPGGVFVMTTPDPRWERVASRLRLLKDAGHEQTLDLTELQELATREGFRVEKAYKFMFSPVGFPAERAIEGVLRALRLDALMANQLVAARKASGNGGA